ncbi:hypothetical protein K6M90_05155 [Rhizobium sp. 9T]|nr:hypothetical protein [Rhizobium croatiense]
MMLALFSVVLQIVEAAMQRGDGRPDGDFGRGTLSIGKQAASEPVDFYWQVAVL